MEKYPPWITNDVYPGAEAPQVGLLSKERRLWNLGCPWVSTHFMERQFNNGHAFFRLMAYDVQQKHIWNWMASKIPRGHMIWSNRFDMNNAPPAGKVLNMMTPPWMISPFVYVPLSLTNMTAKETKLLYWISLFWGWHYYGRYHLKVIHLARATWTAPGFQTAAGRSEHAGGREKW